MATNNDVKTTFTADASGLVNASAKASTAIAGVATASDKAAAATKKAAAAQSSAADQIGKLGPISGKLSSALSMLSPELAEAAGSLGDLADGGELAAEASAALGVSVGAVGAAMGAVASAVALCAAAWVGWTEEAATATRQTGEANAFFAQMAGLQEDTATTIRATRVEMGLMTEAQASMVESGLSAFAQYQTATMETRKRLSELRAEQASFSGQASALLGDIGEALPAQEFNMLAQIIDGVTTSTNEMAVEEGLLTDRLGAAAGEVKANRQAHEALTNAKLKGAKASKASAAADDGAASSAAARAAGEARLKEEIEQRTKAEDDYAAAIQRLRDAASDAAESGLTELERLQAKRDEDLEAARMAASEAYDLASGNAIKQAEVAQASADARLEIEGEYQRAKAELTAEADAATLEAAEKAAADLEQKQKASAQAGQDLLLGALAGVQEFTSTIIDSGLAKSKKSLQALFIAQKAAAVAQAGINTALAVSNALALPLPPPLPEIAAAGAVILGTAQVAAIAASPPPSFRSGYLPDQRAVMFEPSSEIVAPASAVQALGGMDKARQTFAGVGNSAAPQVTQFTIGHRGFSALVANSASRTGPLRDLTVRPSGLTNPYRR